ncbi:DUF6233 domain-containing protein [Streptomyces sp. NPDC056373]
MHDTSTCGLTSPEAVNRDEARRLLASGLPACPHCQPDIDLRILD